MEKHTEELSELRRRLDRLNFKEVSKQLTVGPFSKEVGDNTVVNFLEKELGKLTELRFEAARIQGRENAATPLFLLTFSSRKARDEALKYWGRDGTQKLKFQNQELTAQYAKTACSFNKGPPSRLQPNESKRSAQKVRQ